MALLLENRTSYSALEGVILVPGLHLVMTVAHEWNTLSFLSPHRGSFSSVFTPPIA